MIIAWKFELASGEIGFECFFGAACAGSGGATIAVEPDQCCTSSCPTYGSYEAPTSGVLRLCWDNTSYSSGHAKHLLYATKKVVVARDAAVDNDDIVDETERAHW